MDDEPLGPLTDKEWGSYARALGIDEVPRGTMPPFKRELSIRVPVEDGWTAEDSEALADLIGDVTGVDVISIIEVYIDPA